MITVKFKTNPMEIPDSVNVLMQIFNENGYNIHCVGGCVRDLLLGRTVNDWDLCTNATPDEMILLCEKNNLRYIPTGMKHGTITIFSGAEGYEVTTYRIESGYADGRHPDCVRFTSSIEQDLARRDFTINAMAYNEVDGLIDCFNGQQDLKNKLVRCVGNPLERFREDNLRRLRAIRFAVQLGFCIEQDTKIALQQDCEGMHLLSRERVRDEFHKILISDAATKGIHYLIEFGMISYVMGKLVESSTDLSVLLSRIAHTPARLEVRLAAVLTDLYLGALKGTNVSTDNVGDSDEHIRNAVMCVSNAMKEAKISNRIIDAVVRILSVFIYYHIDMDTLELKHLIKKIGKDCIADAFDLLIANYNTNGNDCDKIEKIKAEKMQCISIIEGGVPLEISDLTINGKDLIELGFTDGIVIGKALAGALAAVLENPTLNTKDQLISMIREEPFNRDETK